MSAPRRRFDDAEGLATNPTRCSAENTSVILPFPERKELTSSRKMTIAFALVPELALAGLCWGRWMVVLTAMLWLPHLGENSRGGSREE
jgi:hypothetical protein